MSALITISLIQISGYSLAISGAILGVAGAWLTAAKETDRRHKGFLCWIVNSPLIVLSLIGIAAGWWTGLTAAALVPLNMIYFGTAVRGWMNTKSVHSCEHTCGNCEHTSDEWVYVTVPAPGWRGK